MIFDIPHKRRDIPFMPLYQMTRQRWRWAVADGKECAERMTFRYGKDPDNWPCGRVAAAECGYSDDNISVYRSFLRGYGRTYDF